ncbi:MAG: GTPase [Thermoplasmata archaeon]
MHSTAAGGAGHAVILSTEEDTAEILELARSAGYEVLRTFVQKRESPDAELYIGKGKVREVADFLRQLEDSGERWGGRGGRECVAIFNGSLKPGQVFHLEKELGTRVLDRVGLILEIFSRRAGSREARLQVELARLRYEVPLVREYIHRTRTGEHPGLFFSGGEYQVDDYYRMIRARMAAIRKELETIGKERAQRRKTRRRGGRALVALAGYTNAGKSALFRALTSEDSPVGPELFTTLSTTTRRLAEAEGGGGHTGRGDGTPLARAGGTAAALTGGSWGVQGSRILLTDTVGFIRDLPPWLIEAFRSTLEEVFLSDVVVVVVDVSDPLEEIQVKTATTLGVLRKGGATVPVVAAFNKMDLVGREEGMRRASAIALRHGLQKYCLTSALDGTGLPELTRLVIESLDDFFYGTIKGPADEVGRLAREEGLRVSAVAGGMAEVKGALLRNWRVRSLLTRYPRVSFERGGGTARETVAKG